MFKKLFKNNKKKNYPEKNVMVAALLVHAAKIDQNYTNIERKIIERALCKFAQITEKKSKEILNLAEIEEQNANQILEFTKEIKKSDMKFRIKIIELLWKIIYSDGIADQYEANLIRRVCGLLYISSKDSGEIELKIQGSQK